MSYIIHEKEIRMLHPKGFHYIYVLTAKKTKKSETYVRLRGNIFRVSPRD